MVRHIVTWKYKEGNSDHENRENAKKIKAMLEALPAQIGGIAELAVHIETLPASNRDVILNSLFESEAALAAYQVHPEHKKVSAFVGTVMQDRVCVDYHE